MAARQAAALKPGTRVGEGRYQIQKMIGRGAFGITYRARNTVSGSDVAIKEYLPRANAHRTANGTVQPLPGGRNAELFDIGKRVFLEETETLRSLPKQRGLVQVLAALRRRNTVCCVMEFVDGEELKTVVERTLRHRPFIPERTIRDLAVDIVSALHILHSEARLTHRDIKPANIMIRRATGEPVLIDFGAARPLDRHVELPPLLTRSYAALEQFNSDVTHYSSRMDVGPWSDLFSLSVVLYEMMSQGLPRPADERFATLRSTGEDPYVPIRDNLARSGFDHDYSDELLDLIDAGCALHPQDRPRSARLFLRRMGERLRVRKAGAQTGSATPIVAPGQVTGIIADWTAELWRRGKLVIIAVAGATVIAAYAYLAGRGVLPW
ncbi:MAG: serine/threonine protein kinase [Rhodobacteraceae bacterium]|jgi:serine/threonine protein kinase|nr:serine/threonine protein kinase [Paracoccaceae bacterium]